MYFPWCGLIDQIRLADVFVHLNDVQFSRGFFNRVQIRTNVGTSWLTVPIQNSRSRQLICETQISNGNDWVSKHRATIARAYTKTQFGAQALAIFDEVTSNTFNTLDQLAIASVQRIAEYFFGSEVGCKFVCSSDLSVGGSSSQRLLDITRQLNGGTYLTGHGAMNYLDHELFEREGINVAYMNYQLHPYSQLHGSFSPYLTSLDAIAHCGPRVAGNLDSTLLDWRESLERRSELRA